MSLDNQRPNLKRAQFKMRRKGKFRPNSSFRRNYDQIDKQHSELISRLMLLEKTSCGHPGYKRAHQLLNNIYGRCSLSQRIDVLKAAVWLINIIESVDTLAQYVD